VATWVCLLRGLNLGAHNRVRMADLRAAATAAGFGQVQTYQQSGNLVVESDQPSAESVGEAAVRQAVRERLDLDVPVVVRSPGQLRDVVAWCPFPDAAARPAVTQVAFLAAEPDPARLAALLEQDWSPDRLAARSQEVAVQYASSMHASPLAPATILQRLGVDGTVRNWRTLLALVDLTADAA